MSADYTVVFDVSQATIYRIIPLAALGLFLVAIGIWKLRYSDPPETPLFKADPFARKIRVAFLVGAVLMTGLLVWSVYTNHRRLADAVERHEAKVVEGRVQDFQPMPYEGHGAREHFCVAEACFEYSDYMVDGGFNNTASHGGPIREGLPVRVTYVGSKIVRLEVVESPSE